MKTCLWKQTGFMFRGEREDEKKKKGGGGGGGEKCACIFFFKSICKGENLPDFLILKSEKIIPHCGC